MHTSKFSIQDICSVALFTAVIAIMAQISIPMPLGVPMTMQTFAITLAAVVLGSRRSFLASLVYLLLGMVGVIMFCLLTGSSVAVGVTACVVPFIPTAIIKAVAAAVIGLQIRKRLVNILYA